MSGTITEHNLFKPARSKSETKSDITNSTARSIIEAEASRREAKTARLRQQRMEKAEQEPVPAPARKQRARKTVAAKKPSV